MYFDQMSSMMEMTRSMAEETVRLAREDCHKEDACHFLDPECFEAGDFYKFPG